jgi:aspartyl-tRNA(Asn)/glutamyl-tRNA(Gln) amidotransferase subunit A
MNDASAANGSLHELGVRAIAAAVARGQCSPTEVLEAFLGRIDAVDPRVQAWSFLDRDDARAQAHDLTHEAHAGKLRGPLHGVLVAVKDEFHIKGQPTGMRGWSRLPLEPEDATCVARLRSAGAIILGKTHMPVNGKNPPTRNPWNLEHTAGGTSSGSGAAVGARMAPVAIAEQTVGSGLRPAAYCGVSAIKPTYGRISRFGCYPFIWSLDHVSIIGLSMEDIALVLSVIAGEDSRDQTSLRMPAPEADLGMAAVAPPRIGLVRNFFPERTEPVMQQAVAAAMERLRAAGASVVDLELPEEFGLAWSIRPLLDAEMHLFHAYDQAISPYAPAPKPQPSDLVPANYYLQARRVRSWLSRRIGDAIREFDAILMAATPTSAPKGLASTGNAALLTPWSSLGLPAITIPAGLCPEGLPLGLQLVAPALADYKLLQVGAWCEAVLGRLPSPPL